MTASQNATYKLYSFTVHACEVAQTGHDSELNPFHKGKTEYNFSSQNKEI